MERRVVWPRVPCSFFIASLRIEVSGAEQNALRGIKASLVEAIGLLPRLVFELPSSNNQFFERVPGISMGVLLLHLDHLRIQMSAALVMGCGQWDLARGRGWLMRQERRSGEEG